MSSLPHEKAHIRYRAIGVLSVAHLMNDLYANYIPQLLPFLVVLMPGFTATRAALLVSAFSIASSFVQPFFGYWLDGRGRRWFVYVGTLWMAVLLSLTGIVSSYPVLVLLAALAGLGTAAFHPQASTMINLLSGERKAGLLSTFMAFGNFGFALSPLLLVPLFQAHGLQATLVTVIPGAVVALLLLLFAPQQNRLSGSPPSLTQLRAALGSAARELTAIVGVIAVRSLVYTGLIAMLPLYFREKQLSNIAASHLVTILLLAGGVGGVVGGFLSDLYGRKRLTVASLFLAAPLFLAFLFTRGAAATVFLALAGAALLSSFSVTVVAAQEAIPANKALAAGLTMGLAGGVGSLAVILVGRVGDLFGLTAAVAVLSALPLAAGAIGLCMQRRPAVPSTR